MIYQAFFGSPQTGLGYQFYDKDGGLLGSRVTTGIDSLPEAGAYAVEAVPPNEAVGIFWDSVETPDGASEDLREALRDIAGEVRTELATELLRIDADISSRNATAPDNAGIAAIKERTDNLPDNPADVSDVVGGNDPWQTVLPGDYPDGSAGAAVGRLNNTPAENPIAILPDPPADADLALLVIDVEQIIGSPVSDLEITVALSSELPTKTGAGRVLLDRDQMMAHSETEAGRYTLAVEKGAEYHLRNRELFGAPGLRITPTEDVINLNSLIA